MLKLGSLFALVAVPSAPLDSGLALTAVARSRSAFKADSDYFGNRRQGHMINYRVADLKKMLAQLKKAGVWVDPKSQTQDSEYGKFAWIKDGEGNRIELWEPPKKKRSK